MVDHRVALTEVLLAATFVGCSKSHGHAAGAGRTAAAPNLSATLEDQSVTAQGRPRWSTYWKLCWDYAPGAVGYELQTITSEGTSPELRQQENACFRLQVASGTSRGARRTVEREQQLGWQSANLAYRVRARFPETPGAWSPVVPAGLKHEAAVTSPP